MRIIKISRVFEAIAFVIGILSLYYLIIPEGIIMAITLMIAMHFPLFISNRLEVIYNC